MKVCEDVILPVVGEDSLHEASRPWDESLVPVIQGALQSLIFVAGLWATMTRKDLALEKEGRVRVCE